MLAVPVDLLHQTIAVLGSEGIAGSDIEIGVASFAPDQMTARRLIDWIPEAFGIVLIPHIAKMNLPATFSARAHNGNWVQVKFEVEPIFTGTLPIAMEHYHKGHRNTFLNIAMRSSSLAVVNNILNAGGSLEGGTLSGPACIGIPAEVYGYQGDRPQTPPPTKKSWFKFW